MRYGISEMGYGISEMGYGIGEWGAKDKKTEAKNWGLGMAAEDGGPRTEDRGRRAEDRGPRTEDRGRRAEDGGPDLGFRSGGEGQKTAD